jgi:glycosyltransferase involved in cell wall biosynthesis/CDP-glycerol glycerophosphotransferase (TagB/SpsB family)
VFSVVSAMYNVEKYLPEFLDSLERQTYGVDEIEIVLVDDGSTDGTARLAAEFVARHPGTARVVTQANGGASSARNAGLALATGAWVTFADSDDKFADDYFARIAEFMAAKHQMTPALYAAHLVFYEEETGELADLHPLRHKFEFGNRVTDLEASPQAIQMHVNSAFFDRQLLVDEGIEFDPRIRPRFEDAHLVSRYLLASPRATLGVVSKAKYHYRRRSDGSSVMQTSHGDPRLYTDVPRYGPIDLLRRSLEAHGRVPLWLQFIVLYDLVWLIKSDQRVRTRTAGVDPAALAQFHENVQEILRHVDEEAIWAFDVMTLAPWMREALVLGYREGAHISERIDIGVPDPQQHLVPIRYRFTGDLPTEEVFVRGQAVEPRHASVRHFEALGRLMIKERTIWVSTQGSIRLVLDGRSRPLRLPTRERLDYRARTFELAALERREINKVPKWLRTSNRSLVREVGSRTKARLRKWRRAWTPEGLEDRFISIALRSALVRRAFGHAWVLMDRDTDANDSAEVLYRWLRANQPDVNAWFVLSKSSPEWKRLKAERVRVVAYGSLRWKLLLLKADHLISSHIDKYVVAPLDPERYGQPAWRYTFLQHGIIKGDISRWLNMKKIDVFVVSTQDEYTYVAGPSTFKFGPREVRLTGLPRHDDLLAASERVPEAERRYIVVMPTWRDYLTGESVGASNERTHNAHFMESLYAQQWRAFLTSDRLREVAREHDLTVAFMPHPNTQPYLPDFDLPDHVEVLRYADHDVRDVIARSVMMVTDYSSIAFNMAYLYRPVVYFQFDTADFYGGEHLERPGYFDYPSHGFGPLADTSDEAVQHVADIAAHGPDEEHLARMKRTFPVRDGRNSQRVYEAVKGLNQPVSFAKAAVARPLDSWDAS